MCNHGQTQLVGIDMINLAGRIHLRQGGCTLQSNNSPETIKRATRHKKEGIYQGLLIPSIESWGPVQSPHLSELYAFPWPMWSTMIQIAWCWRVFPYSGEMQPDRWVGGHWCAIECTRMGITGRVSISHVCYLDLHGHDMTVTGGGFGVGWTSSMVRLACSIDSVYCLNPFLQALQKSLTSLIVPNVSV